MIRCLLAGLALSLAAPARADVIMLPSDEYEESEEIGAIELVSVVRPPEGEDCDDDFAPPCSLLAQSALWEPQELPLHVEVRRDRTGYTIVLLSMLTDRQFSSACWLEEPFRPSGRLSPDKLWAELRSRVERWAASCSTVRAIGVEAVLSDFARLEADFRQALSRIAATRARRLSVYGDGASVGSFLPTRVTQGILDAIADACDGPRDRLRLRPDGSIEWMPDGSAPYGTGESRSFNDCVGQQIQYLPGYAKQS